jgi:hypothetical protein
MMRVDKKEVKMKFQIMPPKPGAKDILCVGVK